MTKKKATLDDFEGFDDNQESFFGDDIVDSVENETEDDDSNEESEEDETEEEEDEDKSSDKDSDEKEETEEEDFFSEDEEDLEDEDGEEESPSKNSKTLDTLNFLKEKGLVDFEEPEGGFSKEEEEDLLEKSWEKSLENTVEEMSQGLPDEVKGLIQFTAKGGSSEDYFEGLKNLSTSTLDEDSDIKDKKIQKKAVTLDLKSQGYDDEYIEDHIEVLEEKGKLGKISEKSFDKIIQKKKDFKKQQIKEVEKRNTERAEKAKDFKKSLTDFISSNKEVNKVKLSDKDKKELPSYISDPTVELKDGRKVSQAQADIIKAMGDTKSLVVLSKLARSGFDIEKLSKSFISKENRKKREKLSNSSRDVRKGAGKTGKRNKPIWESL